MLYLVTPHEVLWCDMPGQTTIRLAAEHDADLGNLTWLPTESPVPNTIVDLALRRGHPCSRGLVLDAGLVYSLTQGDRIRRAQGDAQRAQQALRHNDQLIEQLMPGWTEHGRELDRRIAETSRQKADEADVEAAELLAGDPDPTLVEHWERLGGSAY